MESLIETLPQISGYYPTFVALIILCLMVLIQNFLAGVLGFAPGDETPGMPLKGDSSKFSFRSIRTHANSAENFSPIVATAFLAILAGVGLTLVNWLVGLHVALRAAYWAIYYSGAGKSAGGIRTIVFVIALFMNVILAFATAYTILI